MKNDLILDIALERILDLEEDWQKSRKQTRLITGHTYAQNLSIIRKRAGKETNSLLDLMLVDMPEELRSFIDTNYPHLCLPIQSFKITSAFDINSFVKLERIKRKKPLRHFGKHYLSILRLEKYAKKKTSLNLLVKICSGLNFKLELVDETI
jgi:hypothetical protein